MHPNGCSLHVMQLARQPSRQSITQARQNLRTFSSTTAQLDARWREQIGWDERQLFSASQSHSPRDTRKRDAPQVQPTPAKSATPKRPQVENEHEQAALAAIAKWAEVQEENKTLSLPPFLRTKFEKKLRVGAQYGGVRAAGNKLTERLNRKYAPFATRFHNNVYARMLAEPIREERVTNTRLPRPCLLSFHAVDGTEPAAAEAVQKALDKNPQRPLDLQYYPRTLFGELIHRKSIGKVSEEKQELARALALEKTVFNDKGPATYLLANYDFLDALSGMPRLVHKLPTHSTREAIVKRHGRPANIVWPADTPELVLQTMRQVLWKKMAHMLEAKTAGAENPGLFQAVLPIPGGANVGRLNHIPDVMALVRLQPVPEGTPTAAETYTQKRKHWRALGNARKYPEGNAAVGPQTTEPVDEQPQARLLDQQSADAGLAAFFREIEAATGTFTDGFDQLFEASEAPDPKNKPAAAGLSANDFDASFWLNSEPPAEVVSASEHFKTEGFLHDLKPLPPPTKPGHVYYPTVEYWNRRLPVYSLPFLLGDDMARKMIASTVFKDSEYVAIRAHGGTVSTLEWLWKLHTFIGKEKAESPRI